MARIDNLKGKGVKFGEGQPTNRGGRKKNLKTLLKEKGYKTKEIRKAFLFIAFLSSDECKEIANCIEQPAIFRLIANFILETIKHPTPQRQKQLFEMTLGKSVERKTEKNYSF